MTVWEKALAIVACLVLIPASFTLAAVVAFMLPAWVLFGAGSGLFIFGKFVALIAWGASFLATIAAVVEDPPK